MSEPLNRDKSNKEDIVSADRGPSTSTLNVTKVVSGFNILKNEDNLFDKNIFKNNSTYSIYPPLVIARVGNGTAKKQDVLFTPEVPWQNLYETK